MTAPPPASAWGWRRWTAATATPRPAWPTPPACRPPTTAAPARVGARPRRLLACCRACAPQRRPSSAAPGWLSRQQALTRLPRPTGCSLPFDSTPYPPALPSLQQQARQLHSPTARPYRSCRCCAGVKRSSAAVNGCQIVTNSFQPYSQTVSPYLVTSDYYCGCFARKLGSKPPAANVTWALVGTPCPEDYSLISGPCRVVRQTSTVSAGGRFYPGWEGRRALARSAGAARRAGRRLAAGGCCGRCIASSAGFVAVCRPP